MWNLIIRLWRELHGTFRVIFKFSRRPLQGGTAPWGLVSFDFQVDWLQADNSKRLSRDEEGPEGAL